MTNSPINRDMEAEMPTNTTVSTGLRFGPPLGGVGCQPVVGQTLVAALPLYVGRRTVKLVGPISWTTVTRWAAAGRIRLRQVGRRKNVVRTADLIQLIESGEV